MGFEVRVRVRVSVWVRVRVSIRVRDPLLPMTLPVSFILFSRDNVKQHSSPWWSRQPGQVRLRERPDRVMDRQS